MDGNARYVPFLKDPGGVEFSPRLTPEIFPYGISRQTAWTNELGRIPRVRIGVRRNSCERALVRRRRICRISDPLHVPTVVRMEQPAVVSGDDARKYDKYAPRWPNGVPFCNRLSIYGAALLKMSRVALLVWYYFSRRSNMPWYDHSVFRLRIRAVTGRRLASEPIQSTISMP